MTKMIRMTYFLLVLCVLEQVYMIPHFDSGDVIKRHCC